MVVSKDIIDYFFPVCKGTVKGKHTASQALARIGITMNPEVAFPGQRSCEIVRPMLSLLHPDCTALENFEGLMCLCNLAGFDAPRKRIVQEKGLSRIEHYMYEDHELLKRAAVQLMNNMVFSEEVVKLFEGKNDRTRYLVLLCATTDDHDLVQAAIGTLAVLTAVSKRVSKKVFEAKEWSDTFGYLMTHENKDIQLRAVAMVCSVVKHSKELAEKMLEKEVLKVLDVLVKLGEIPYNF